MAPKAAKRKAVHTRSNHQIKEEKQEETQSKRPKHKTSTSDDDMKSGDAKQDAALVFDVVCNTASAPVVTINHLHPLLYRAYAYANSCVRVWSVDR
jgi:hypothetical protein